MFKRLITSDADAKRLEGLVAEMSTSIHDDFLVSVPDHIDLLLSLTDAQLEQVLVNIGCLSRGHLTTLL